MGLRRFLLTPEDPGPVEPHVRMRGLDQAYGLRIERGAADPDAWRRPEPVEDARVPPGALAGGVNDERVLVTALVAREAEARQIYFLFCARAAVLAAGAFARAEGALFRAPAPRRGAAAATRFLAVSGGSAAGRA